MRSLLLAYRQAYAGLPRDTWLVALVTFVNRCGTMVMPFLTLYLTERLGYQPKVAGLFVMVYGIGAMLGTTLGGKLTDRLGAVPVQFLSLGVAGALFLLLGTLRHAWSIGAALLAVGIFAEAFRPASAALIAATCPADQRTRAYALQRLAINLGMTVGPAVGGWLTLIGYVWLFCVDGATCLAAAILLVWLFGRRRFSTQVRTESINSAPGPWRDRVMLTAMALALLTAFVFFQLFSTLPLYFRNAFGMSKSTIGTLIALNPLLVVLFEMVVVDRLRRINPLRIVAVGALFVGFGFGILPLGRGLLFAALTIVLWTIGEILESPQLAGFVSNRATDASRGRYMGLYGLVYSVALIVAPATGTAIYDRLGPTILWSACAVVGVCSCTGYLVLATRVDREAQSKRLHH